jgi:Domain of unknown function (DUF4129)
MSPSLLGLPFAHAAASVPAAGATAVSAASADGEIGRDPARDLARRELSRPEYHQDDPSLPERIWERFSEWLRSFIDSFGGGPSSGRLSWGVLIALAVLLVVVGGLIWWRMGGVQRSRSRRGALLPERATTAADHRAAAQRHAAAGEWPEAIRERLRAIARDLEDRAILAQRPGRTADEMAAEAASALPGHADELRAGAQIFDEVWYGRRRGDETGYQRLTALDERLRTARPAPISMAATSGSPR